MSARDRAAANSARTKAAYPANTSGGRSGRSRRVTTSTAASTDGRGRKPAAGRRRPRAKHHHGPQVAPSRSAGAPASTRARCRATCHCTTRSARSSPPPGSSRSRRSTAAVWPNGGFATTRYGVSGSGTSARSARSTVTLGASREALREPDREPRRRARPRAPKPPRAASAAVSTPVPAPRSTTRCADVTPASPTSRAASRSLPRKCWPSHDREVAPSLRLRPPALPSRVDRQDLGLRSAPGSGTSTSS